MPVAAAAVGTQAHLLRPGEPAALILGALVTVAVAVGSGRALPDSHPEGHDDTTHT